MKFQKIYFKFPRKEMTGIVMYTGTALYVTDPWATLEILQRSGKHNSGAVSKANTADRTN